MMSTSRPASGAERRQFPRVSAPMYCRPARRRLLRRRKVIDVGLGGMRVYSDDDFGVGERMEIDLLHADGDEFITCITEVVWTRPIPGGQPAKFDIGLRFLDVPHEARAMISKLIADAEARDRGDDG